MATGDNAITPLYEPGTRITAAATGAIGAGKFVKIGGNFQGGPLLDLTGPTTPLVKGNLPQVSVCGAGQKAFGVSGADASGADEVLPIINGPGIVVPMTAGATITAGNEVMSDASGNPVPWTSAASEANRVLGLAISGAANAAAVYVRLYT